VLALIAHGRGVALLPRLALHAVPDTVVVRPLADAPLTRFLYVARPSATRAAPAADALAGALRVEAARPGRPFPIRT